MRWAVPFKSTTRPERHAREARHSARAGRDRASRRSPQFAERCRQTANCRRESIGRRRSDRLAPPTARSQRNAAESSTGTSDRRAATCRVDRLAMWVCWMSSEKTGRTGTGQRVRRNKIGRLHEACQRSTTYAWKLRFGSARNPRCTQCIGTPAALAGQTPATRLPGWTPCGSCNATDKTKFAAGRSFRRVVLHLILNSTQSCQSWFANSGEVVPLHWHIPWSS